ncbi:hypothetical protein KEM55_008343 [Ascosphaera atra]|nr:hypothetical protein KEM55_008343 [Ascosphaera atra]
MVSRSRFTPGDLLTTASNDITHALRRTHNLLVNELSRSQFASDTLAQSSAALQSLGSSYTDLDSMLSTTKTLLGGLLRSQKSDTWYLETTVYLLVGTIAWLVFRRLLWGPAWWLVWMPLKITYKGAGGGVGLVRRLSSGGERGLAEVGYGGGQGEGVFMDAGVPIAAPAWPAEPALGEVEREGNKGAMEHIERIVTSVPGEGAQTQSSGAETTHTEAGYAIPVDNVPGGPDGGEQVVGQEGGEGKRGSGITLPDPEDDKDLPRNPKKRMHEEDVHAPARDEL